MITITKEFTFDSAHLLPDHEGLCRNIHGHTYKLLVEIGGKIQVEGAVNGMLIDFKQLKTMVKEAILDKFDHALIIDKSVAKSPLGKALIKSGLRVVNIGCTPTAENMSIIFYNMLKKEIAPMEEVFIYSVTLYETPTSFAKYGR